MTNGISFIDNVNIVDNNKKKNCELAVVQSISVF